MTTRVLAIIPARGGSKGIPRKNLTHLAGRPLLAYTFDAALASSELDRIIVSTDDEEIAAYAIEQGIDAPFRRPADLASDEAPMIDVLRHGIEEMERMGVAPEIIVLLQPTSPLRSAEDIDEAVRMLATSRADTVVSVVPVPHRFNPVSVMVRQPDGTLRAFAEDRGYARRQDKPEVYARNGPAILVVRADIIRAGRLYGDRVIPYEMPLARSIDIDEPSDLAEAGRRLAALKASDGQTVEGVS